MGMGYAGAYADQVDTELLRKICPKKYREFCKLFDELVELNYSPNDLYRALQWNETIYNGDGEPTEKVIELDEAYIALCKRFKRLTGLNISCYYHNSEDEGDRYDEIDGFIWQVDNAYEMTKSAKKHKKHITRQFFVQFG